MTSQWDSKIPTIFPWLSFFNAGQRLLLEMYTPPLWFGDSTLELNPAMPQSLAGGSILAHSDGK